MISDSSIDEIKKSVDTLDIVSSFVTMKKKGVDYLGLCPFHDEKSPSFTISPVRNMYKCFGCGKSGNGISFLMEHQRMDYISALKWVADKNNITIEQDGKPKIYVKPVQRVEGLSKKALNWFEDERKISKTTLTHFGITEAKEWMPQLQSEATAICFNYFREDELVNIKFRGAKKSFKLAKDAELIFYNINSIKGESVAYITEGEIDCMSLYEVGITNVVSVPNGANVSGNVRLEYLDNCWQYFVDKTKIVLVVDNDEAGNRLRLELGRRFGLDKCFIVNYPKGCKDANDTLIKHGKDELLSILNNCIKFPLIGEKKMDTMYDTIESYYDNGYPKGIPCNLSNDFNELLNFFPGELTMVTGIPGSGKSEVVDAIMANITVQHGWDWGVCSFECAPEFHATKLCEKITKKAFGFRKDKSQRMSKDEFHDAIGIIDQHFHFMNVDVIDVTMDGLLSKAEEFVLRYGIRGFLFDPWNCIAAQEEGVAYILRCLNKLLAFISKFQVHVILVAHPTKLQKDKGTGKYEVPTLYNISGSADFFNKTHNGFTVYRDFSTNVVTVYVQKVKQYWLGKVGFCSFDFNTQTRQYIPINDKEKTKEDETDLPF